MIRNISIIFCLIFLYSCGSKTTVILLPEQNGETGSIVVNSRSSSIVLTEPYTYTAVTYHKSALSVKPVDQIKMKAKYHLLLDSELIQPVHFTLYFEHNSTTLTKDSMSLIPEILRIAKEREPSEISIIGHTDSKGSSEYNNELALKRAKAVEKIILEFDTSKKNLHVTSYGENDPIVITGDGISEVKNRRVEIMIR